MAKLEPGGRSFGHAFRNFAGLHNLETKVSREDVAQGNNIGAAEVEVVQFQRVLLMQYRL